MASVSYLIKKAKEKCQQDGIAETLRFSINYVRREIRERIDSTDYLEKNNTGEKCSYQDEAAANCPKGPVIYIAATVPFYDVGGGQRCSQLTKTFHNMGYCVRYFYSHHIPDDKNRRMEVPAESHAILNNKALDFIKKRVKKEDIFIFEAPVQVFAPLLEIAVNAGCRVIYENIDNWETSLGRRVLHEETLRQMLHHAQVLTGTAKPLVEQLHSYLIRYGIPEEGKKICYLANAVDDGLFDGRKIYECPEDMVRGAKTLLYYGSLWGEWFDWDIILGLAKKHPEYSINLIGDVENIRGFIKNVPDNVHFLGTKLQKTLPAYLKYSDYAMIPFKRGEIGDYVSPLKIFEYISMHTRVLSTSLPDIQGYPNLYVGDSMEEWEAVIMQNPKADFGAADEFIDKNNWKQRANAMLEALGERE